MGVALLLEAYTPRFCVICVRFYIPKGISIQTIIKLDAQEYTGHSGGTTHGEHSHRKYGRATQAVCILYLLNERPASPGPCW